MVKSSFSEYKEKKSQVYFFTYIIYTDTLCVLCMCVCTCVLSVKCFEMIRLCMGASSARTSVHHD